MAKFKCFPGLIKGLQGIFGLCESFGTISVGCGMLSVRIWYDVQDDIGGRTGLSEISHPNQVGLERRESDVCPHSRGPFPIQNPWALGPATVVHQAFHQNQKPDSQGATKKRVPKHVLVEWTPSTNLRFFTLYIQAAGI